MNPIAAIRICITKAFVFSGRATRSEFNWFLVFVLVGLIAAMVLQSMIWGWTLKSGSKSSILTYVFLALIALPLFAVSVRRMQDTGLPLLILFIPALLSYASWYVFIPLSHEYAALTQGPETLPGHVDNIFRDLSRFSFWAQKYGLYIIALILVAVPTDGAKRLRAQLSQPKERQP